ncbi:hypothetical protein [Endozoicomonas sp. GU-1]|uniref:hypothetical protein n=1 Tax=Endozoicomonas sp. GU-1 TaxID=3009078 RepID=UPI0022B4A575|nr:hypothetical protein [Endozoicomonas sp. GU-1]WBA84394.1 hypothetical protein O3276_13905 [Endozoicomonas sp. GU-1]
MTNKVTSPLLLVRHHVDVEHETGDHVVTEEGNKQTLTELFMETRPETTPKLISERSTRLLKPPV